MKSRLTPSFRKAFDKLPHNIQAQARNAYRQFRTDPYHGSLRFKRVSQKEPIYSVRIGDSHRALGMREQDDRIVWFWIGSHAEYDNLLRNR
ncbi:MAG: hypothetical protein GC179_09065 [Anaerolineaceae bacterium]|nr:hypothetical protein [Anaerolineaceae bacterium]